jgi:hypothetical protein
MIGKLQENQGSSFGNIRWTLEIFIVTTLWQLEFIVEQVIIVEIRIIGSNYCVVNKA